MEQPAADFATTYWYDVEFAPAQLDMERDGEWLARLAGRELDTDDIAAANRFVANGSINLRYETDPETIQGVLEARERFFGEFLAWASNDHPLHNAYQKFEERSIARMPLATVIQTQRVLADLGLDPAKVINALPSALGYAPDSVRAKVDNLRELGLDPAKVINAFPAALGYAPDSVRAKVDNLRELGLDSAKVITAHPVALNLAPDSVRAKVYALMKTGLVNDEQPFPTDEAFIKNFFILPTESLLLYLADHPDTDSVDLMKLPYRARAYARQRGATTSAERKMLYEHEYGNPESQLRQTLGYVAVLNAMRLKLDSANSETIRLRSAL